MAQRTHGRAVAFLVAIGLVVAACDDGGKGTTDTSTSRPTTTTAGNGTGNGTGDGAAPRTLGLRLSEGEALAVAPEPTPVVDGDPLDQSRIDEITARLPEWTDVTSQHQSFNWPVQSSPPPRTGATVAEQFPPTETTPVVPVDSGPLTVLRRQPDGDVPIAPYVAITFNQAMVPVGTVSQLNGADVPFTISPELPGTWQWIGTHTARFDADSDLVDRLPMATTFTVTVPASTTSATGVALGEAVTWTFTTPPPTVESFVPQSYGSQDATMRRDQIFVATFDQRIDPAAVLDTMHLRAGGDEVAVRLATDDEVAADDTARNISESAEPGRWLAFRPVELMPGDSALTIDIGPGTPSAEGPGVTDATQSFTGHTYAPLRVVRASCAWGSECPPGSELTVELNNALDGALSDAGAVTVSPELAGMAASTSWSVLSVRGATQARTTYTITVPGSFTDIYGQTLGDDTDVTVQVGSATPSIQPYDPITTLDPFAEQQQLAVLTVNHDDLRVRVYAADPARFAEYRNYRYTLDDPARQDPAWELLSDETVTVDGDDDTATETPIDLTDELQGAHGQVIVLVEPVPVVRPNASDYWQNRPALTWVQSTQLGIDSLSDATHAVVWATDLRTGAPAAEVALSLAGATAATDADGLGSLPLPAPGGTGDESVLIATHGDDTAILPLDAYRQTVLDEARWYVFDDRQVYRPGETMRVKGWVRRLTLSDDATLKAIADGASVHYAVSDSYGNELLQGDAPLGALGGFDLELALPATANVGPASLNLALLGEPGIPGSGNWHQFQIQEYRRPEFEVTTRPESDEPFLSTQPATIAASGNYYAGGPLANAPVDWSVSTTPTTYAPPGWADFAFGVWIPWWYGPDYSLGGAASDVYYSEDVSCCGATGDTTVKEYHGATDSDGNHYLQVDFEGDDGNLPDLPVAISAQATITDVNRQAWSSTSSMLVHAADRYVGLRSSRTFVRQGDPLDIEAIITDVDGAVVSGVSVDVVAGRVESAFVDGVWTDTVVDPQTCTITSADEPVPCQFDTAIGGQYKITAAVADDHGGHNRTELTTWVSGATSAPTRGVDQQSLTVVPDKAEYAVGDTAELLVQAPFTTGEGLLTISRSGIRDTMRFTLVDGSAVAEIPIHEADVPQLSLSLEVVGATPRTNDDGTPVDSGPQQPAYAVGSMTLPVPPVSRALTVTATPRRAELAPGESTPIDVTVHDANGAPVEGAEFAIVVVDEAVLALSDYTLTDPLSVFYAPGYDWVTAAYGRQQIRLLNPDLLSGSSRDAETASTAAASETTAAGDTAAAPSAAQDDSLASTSGGGEKTSATSTTAPVDVRSNFDALALFQPTVTTDANGSATVDLTLPDNLTRYRVMVVAVSGADRFGSAESNLTARLPLAVRPSAPRFANFGDRFELPVVVQNQGDAPLDVDVVLQASNLTIEGAAGRHVVVPANDRVEVRFPVATVDPGTASFRVAVVSGDLADAATVELPVYTPATAEAFATYGVIDDGAVDQPVLAPTDVVPGFGGLEVSTSSTSLQALTDAVLYLVDYPYETSDAMASRIIAISALADVLDAFDAAGMPTPAEIDTAMKDDIAGLAALQNDDGGFPFWRRYDEVSPFNTVQATHALLLARDRGYAVPQYTLDMALAYISDIESHIPGYYGQQERDSISAYALWVRQLAGQGDSNKAQQLYDSRGDELTLDAIAWLWSSIDDSGTRAEIERTIGNRAVETAGAANFTTQYGDSSYLIMQSDRRTDGIVLEALIANTPGSDLIPKVVTGLLAEKVKGRWDNVQENAFVLLALKSYFDTYEAQTPDFVARVWLGERFAGDHTFQGRETDRATIAIPTGDLIAAGNTDLVLAKDGSGRLYYRIGLRYAPADLQLDALDRGFVVDRVYEAVDDPADVSRDADGTWYVKAGARVRVTLTMVAESQRTHVALVDPLPAGLESLNPALAITQTVTEPTDGSTDGPYPIDGGSFSASIVEGWCWYEHEQLRDDRTEAFTTLLPAGTYTYSYVARATTPGSYVVPPTRAEEMYAPETFGRTATDHLVVE